MAVKPVVSDERKALNKEIKVISDANVQKMVDLFRAYETAKEQFDTLIAKLNDQKSKKNQANIFEPFFRAENTENITGTGLGLAIVKRSIEQKKGRLSFVSEEGKGTMAKGTPETCGVR